MGRRKKEPKSTHREKIAAAASTLFMQKGITATSMDDIAKAAGYSKATLYVYFKNKEEIIGILVLDSMVQYQEAFPFYFKMVLDNINIDFENNDCLPEEKETYQIGEKINDKLKDFLISGMENGDLREDLKIIPTIFTFWGMLSGLIQLATNKENYIQSTMNLSKKQFLDCGFQMLYQSIAKEK